jgi:drug/metabolite transporter (DMT)-like permease
VTPAGVARIGRVCVGPTPLLILVVLVWAVSWPVIKIGVANLPPIWYGCLRYAVATVCLFCYLIARRMPLFPPRSDWPLVAVSGVLQMAAYSALTGIALTILPPGRASVLAFSTPLWVVPLAAWRLRETVSRLALLGVAMGLLGVLAIASPSLHADGRGEVSAYCMLFGASAAWAVSIVFVRGHRMAASALALAPWQMAIAAALLCVVALAAEGPLPGINGSGIASLLYVGPFATAFAYWAVVAVGHQFRARTVSMSLLATPCLGILVSAVVLGEVVDHTLVLGLVLVLSGIAASAKSH